MGDCVSSLTGNLLHTHTHRHMRTCTHTHTPSPCSHCFIEHLGSILHFKNIGNSTTSVCQHCVCIQSVCWTAVVPLVGDFTVDILLLVHGTGTNDARNKNWYSDTEQCSHVGGGLLLQECVWVRAGGDGGKGRLPDLPPTNSDQLYKLTQEHTHTHKVGLLPLS